MIRNFILMVAAVLSLNLVPVGIADASASPDDILNDMLANVPVMKEIDTYGTTNYGKVKKGSRPNNALCEVNTFYLDEPSVVRVDLKNSADDGIVYYRLVNEYSKRDMFGPFRDDKLTFVLAPGRYSLKTNLLAVKPGASAKYKSNIYAVPVPISVTAPGLTADRASRINLDDTIVQCFASGSDDELAHYYKFSLKQRQKFTIYASQAGYIGGCSVQILSRDGEELTEPIFFGTDNLINETYTAPKGEYVLKLTPTSCRGSAYFFMIS